MQHSPRLIDLGRTVGLPHTKLNFYIRKVYGRTIFSYFRELRMAKAKSLLDQGEMSVTEVAYEVGYASLSHFCQGLQVILWNPAR